MQLYSVKQQKCSKEWTCFSADTRIELFCTLKSLYLMICPFWEKKKTWGRLFVTQKNEQNWFWLDSSSFPYGHYIFCFRRKQGRTTVVWERYCPPLSPFASLWGRSCSCRMWFYLLPAHGSSSPLSPVTLTQACRSLWYIKDRFYRII